MPLSRYRETGLRSYEFSGAGVTFRSEPRTKQKRACAATLLRDARAPIHSYLLQWLALHDRGVAGEDRPHVGVAAIDSLGWPRQISQITLNLGLPSRDIAPGITVGVGLGARSTATGVVRATVQMGSSRHPLFATVRGM